MIKEKSKTMRLSHFSIERAPDIIFWIDSEGNIDRVNETACQVLGYKSHELTNLKVYDLNPEDNEDHFQKRWQQTKKRKVWNYEWIFYTKEGRAVPVEIMRNYIEFEGKEYSCSFVRDITERKQAENALKKALAEVESLKNQLHEENLYLRHEIKLTHNFEEIIGQSNSIKKVLEKVEQVAETDSTVLIMGETGTGKELIARATHFISRRRDRPLVKVNCAALPVNLIESELFGHEKGSFTGAFERKIGRFELADKGTIFLDEIGDLPIETQVKLLRVLQDGEFERLGNPNTIQVNVRVIAATNRDLERSILDGNFREDLYYRLNVFPIKIPTLKERKDDIPILVNHFIKKYSAKIGKKVDIVPVKVIRTLQSYNWPGNIRELENVIERAIIVNQGNKLQLGEWAPKEHVKREKSNRTLEDIQRQHILDVLKLTHWQVSGDKGAAKVLAINPNTLVSKMKKLNIHRPKL